LSLENRKSAALEDPGAEMVNRLTSWAERYGRIAVGALVVVVVVAAAVVLYMRAEAAKEEQAATRLAEASLMFWNGDYQRSLEAAQQVATQYGSTPSGRDARRLAGDDAFWLNDYKAAIEHYRKFLAGSSSSMLSDAVRRSLAYALENAKQFKEAADTYDSLVGRFDRESSGEFLASSSRCFMALGQPAEAARRLQRLVNEFGDTSPAARAQADLAALAPATK
jgi:tetratricopeptide (TPR) repeat protein